MQAPQLPRPLGRSKRMAFPGFAFLLCGSFCLGSLSVTLASAQSPASAPKVEVPGRFVDITEKSGAHFLHRSPHTSRKYLIETLGSGAAHAKLEALTAFGKT